MKNFWVWCLVAFLGLPNMAYAHADAVGIRVFDIHSYTSGYDERAEFWSGCPVIGDAIDTDCLAEKAYDFAQSTGALSRVPERNQFRESYKDLFLRWNDLGSTMSVSRFMRKATGTGFYLPQGRGRFTPLSSVEWSSIRGDVDLLQQQMRTLEPESAQSLRDRINALEDRLVGVDPSTASLLGTLSTLETVVKNLPSLSQAELDAQKAELDDRLSGLSDRVTRVEETKADKAEVASQLSSKADKSDVTRLEALMKSFENPVIRAPFTSSAETAGFLAKLIEWLVKNWWLPVLLLLLLVIAWLLKSRKNTLVKKEVATLDTPVVVVPSNFSTMRDVDQYETLHTQVNDLDTRVGVRLNRLEEAIAVLRNDYDYLLLVSADGLRMVGTPDQKTLDALTIGKHIDLLVEGNEGARTVRIVRGTFENENGVIEDRLYLYGVSDVNIGVRVDSVGLSKCLLKAVKDWRVVGIDDHKVGLSAAAYKRNPTTRKAPVKRAA